MPEISISGANEITYPIVSTWGWEIATYLFLGGLVAGLMILGGVFRIADRKGFERSILIGDLFGLPLLSVGMLLLFADLGSKINVWRLYTTLQLSSPMSWGSWILLLTMALLMAQFVSALPLEWGPVRSVARVVGARRKVLAPASVVLGIAVGVYTGVLLSSISARPLWDSPMLPFLFLASGLAGGGAFLCLFVPEREHRRLVPFSVSICGVELLVIAAYALTMSSGADASRRAAALLFGGTYGLLFWGAIVFMGLIVPAAVEGLDLMHRQIRFVPDRVPPVLKLAGGVTLRFVIVFAGLHTFV